MDVAKQVQRIRLVAAFLVLPGQVERLARVLPGLLAASRQTTDLAEPCDPEARPRSPPVRIPSLIASSSSARPSARRPWQRIRHSPGPPRSLGKQTRLPEARQRARPARTPGWRAPGPPGRGTARRGSAWAMIGVAPRPASVARRSASSPWRRPSAKAPSALKVRASQARDCDQRSLHRALPDLPVQQPPRSAAAARPPGRSRRWHGRSAPGMRMRPACKARIAERRPRARGPAGPPPWRGRGLPSA